MAELKGARVYAAVLDEVKAAPLWPNPAFAEIGTVDTVDLARDIEAGEWAGEPLTLDLAPRTITAEATFHGDAALKIRRELARACGAPIPTTSGFRLDPHTERRAAIRAIRARHVLELAGAKRTSFLPSTRVPGVVVRGDAS